MKQQTDNSNVALKVAVRRWALERMERPWHVLDLYCGKDGKMFRHVWQEADSYFGTDAKRPHNLAPTVKMTAERASQQLDLGRWNVFDLDCYDSPWVVARQVFRRRPAGRFIAILTSGEDRGLKGGTSNEIIRVTLGLSNLSDLRLLGRYGDLVTNLMIRSLIELPGVRLVAGVQAKTSRNIRYIGLVVDKH